MKLKHMTPFPPDLASLYRQKGYWRDRPLIERYEESFHAYSERTALVDDHESVTYAELARRSERLARVLADQGIRPRDRVVVQLPNTIAFVCLYLALQHIGAIPIMALPSHRYREVEQFVRLSGAVALASPVIAKDADFRDIFSRIAAQEPSLRLHITFGEPTATTAPDTPQAGARTGWMRLEELLRTEPLRTVEDLAALRSQIDPEDAAVFQLSGGTTGIPKLIPRSHNDYAFNSELAASVVDIRQGDVLLDVLPLAHNLPLACPGLQGFLFSGATVALGTSIRPQDIFGRIERDKVTHMHVVPALLIKMINDGQADQYDLSTVRVIQSGGQRLQPETRVRAGKVFGQAMVQENFGMAEGLLMFVRLDDPAEVRLETVGRPVCSDDEIRIVDDNGNDVPDGTVGELWTRGPYTLRGYYNAPEHNQKAFSLEGFYMSGDLMWKHPSGNYVVAGRKKDLINRGGEKISAEEVENLILTHPSVLNVACVPVDDAVLGERMCACVVLRPGTTLTLPDLVSHLTGFELARHKLPESLKIYDNFPLSPVGKVSKKDLVADLHKD
ncbi:(2,3-dihydroxybenzoyl)adenylate synthase [Streptomyces sp. NPDC101225]|uniref:(2,3-dihydroxybenzoyl)adenylate synthase n=1 Tax=Streptomyces sp. NPDC101225 TaxID=3366135 RepID=UPI0037F2341B